MLSEQTKDRQNDGGKAAHRPFTRSCGVCKVNSDSIRVKAPKKPPKSPTIDLKDSHNTLLAEYGFARRNTRRGRQSLETSEYSS
jgi:hypothetical protein